MGLEPTHPKGQQFLKLPRLPFTTLAQLYGFIRFFKNIWFAGVLFPIHTSNNIITDICFHITFQSMNNDFLIGPIRFYHNRLLPILHINITLCQTKFFLPIFISTNHLLDGNGLEVIDTPITTAERNRHTISCDLLSISNAVPSLLLPGIFIPAIQAIRPHFKFSIRFFKKEEGFRPWLICNHKLCVSTIHEQRP